jgi:hypothetical protein
MWIAPRHADPSRERPPCLERRGFENVLELLPHRPVLPREEAKNARVIEELRYASITDDDVLFATTCPCGRSATPLHVAARSSFWAALRLLKRTVSLRLRRDEASRCDWPWPLLDHAMSVRIGAKRRTIDIEAARPMRYDAR